jgi:hypothetical protein
MFTPRCSARRAAEPWGSANVPRLPTIAGDLNAWGTLLNGFLSVSHNADGSIKADTNISVFGTVGDGVTDEYAAIQARVTALGTTVPSLISFPPGTYRLGSSLTIPSNITVEMRGGLFSIDAARTLTINGPFNAGLQQCFTGAGTVRFGTRTTREIYPQWWGAKGNGVADDYAPIQAALAASDKNNQNSNTVRLPNGVYLISQPLLVYQATDFTGTGGVSPFGYGTVIQPISGFTGTELIAAEQTKNAPSTNPWAHGTIIRNLALLGVTTGSVQIAGLSGILWCGGENSLLDTIMCNSFSVSGFHMVRGSAPNMMRNLNCYYSQWGVWFDAANGAHTIESLTGDNNDQMINIVQPDLDANNGGAGLDLVIGLLKTECGSSSKNNPVVRCTNLNQGSVYIMNGAPTDFFTPSATTTLTTQILAVTAMTGAGTVTVASTAISPLPTTNSPVTFNIGTEHFTATGRTATTYTGVTRATDGTTAALHNAADVVSDAKPDKAICEMRAVGSVINQWGEGSFSCGPIDTSGYPYMLRDFTVNGGGPAHFDVHLKRQYPVWERTGWFNYHGRNTFWSEHGPTGVAAANTRGIEIVANYPTVYLMVGNNTLTGTPIQVTAGPNTPEAAITAPPGSIFLRTNGGAATSFYVKESGTGNTGWVAK